MAGLRQFITEHLGFTIDGATSSGAGDAERKPIGLEPQADLTVLAEALRAIPCAKLDYQTWIGILHAAKAASGGNEDFYAQVVTPWCLTYPKNTPDAVREKWDSISDSTIGAEYLFGRARDRGWHGGSAETVFDDESTGDMGAEQTENTQFEADGVQILNGADIVIRNVSWLWEDWLAQGKLHMIGGAPGDGKTTISLAWGAIISVGGRWPDGSQAPFGDILIWSGEDDVADTLLPRFIAAGGDRRRFHIVGPVKENGQKRPFDPSKDVAKLIAAAQRIPNLRLVIIDPIVAAVAGDSHKASEVRRALYPFVVFAEKVGAAILGISHFAKGSQGKSPLERLLGSQAFGAAGRIVYGSALDQETGTRRLVRVKSNLGPTGDGWEFTLEQTKIDDVKAQRAVWGNALTGGPKKLLDEAEGVEEGPKRQSRKEGAVGFLRGVLANGSMPAKWVQNVARQAGHSEKTIQRAKKSLGVISDKINDAGWNWRLPTPEEALKESFKPLTDGETNE